MILTPLLLILLLLALSSGKIYKEAKLNGAPSNRRRTGRPPIFDDAEKQRFVDLVTRCTKKTLDLGSDMHGNGNGIGGNMGKSGGCRGFGSLLEREGKRLNVKVGANRRGVKLEVVGEVVGKGCGGGCEEGCCAGV